MGLKISVIFILLLASPVLETQEKFSRTQVLMGDVPVSITIEARSSQKEKAYGTMEEAFLRAKKLEEEVSERRPQSQASLLNQNAGRAWVPIGTDLMHILQISEKVSQITDGAFDITFRSPKKRQVRLIPELGLASLEKGVRITVSGIAKGYIVDGMSKIVRQRGFRRFLINAGDLFASGLWKIDIRNPDDPSGQPICRITVQNRAVSTSGNYERGDHIIDPQTGKAARKLKSVTVIARSSVLADALATGLFVAGPEKIPSMIKKAKEVDGVIWVNHQGIPEVLGGIFPDG